MKFIDLRKDRWHSLGGEDGPPVYLDPVPDLLLSLPQWRAFRSTWPAGMAVGVTLANDAEVRDLAADLSRFELIQLHFPKWTDGRAYSQAHLLRSRYRYAGELRAAGEVLVDMVPLLARTGFDAAVLRADQSLDAARRALGFFPGHYQGDVADPLPLFAKPPGTADALAQAKAVDFVDAGASI